MSPELVQHALSSLASVDDARSPSLSSDSSCSQQTPKDRPDATFGLARARLELAATTRANAQIVELRAALVTANRAERRRATELAHLRQDVRQLMALVSGRDDVLDRVDRLLDRSQNMNAAREQHAADLQEQLADAREQLAELCELHRMHVTKLAMEHEMALNRHLLQYDADLRMERELVNDLRFELEARDEQLSSLRTALDVVTSPRPRASSFLGTPSPCAVFSLPATPGTASPAFPSLSDGTQAKKASPLTALKAQNALLMKTISAKDADVSVLTVNLVEARERLSELQAVIVSKDAELDGIAQELQRLRGKVAQLESETQKGSRVAFECATDVEVDVRPNSAVSMSRVPVSRAANTRMPALDIQARLAARSRSSSSASSKIAASKSAAALAPSARPSLQSLVYDASFVPRKAIPKSTSVPLIPVAGSSASTALRPRAGTAPSRVSTTSSGARPAGPLMSAARIGPAASRMKSAAPASRALSGSGLPSLVSSRPAQSRAVSASRQLRSASNPSKPSALVPPRSKNVAVSGNSRKGVTGPALEDLTNSPNLGDAFVST